MKESREHGQSETLHAGGWTFLETSPAEDPESEEVDSTKKTAGPPSPSGAPNVAHEARVGRPVHAELELLLMPVATPSERDQHQRPRNRSPSALLILRAVPAGLVPGREKPADRERHKNEVIKRNYSELPAGQLETGPLQWCSFVHLHGSQISWQGSKFLRKITAVTGKYGGLA